MKLLLYCTKANPYLRKLDNYFLDNHKDNYYWSKGQTTPFNFNGKIVAECDFEVEEINYRNAKFVCNRYYLEILKKSCLTDKQMYDYLKGKNGYAIHIKNLHIFDEPRELSDFNKIIETPYGEEPDTIITKAPQNMMRCCYEKKPKEWKTGVLISIKTQWLCIIINKEKTIEVIKKVLKEMYKNE